MAAAFGRNVVALELGEPVLVVAPEQVGLDLLHLGCVVEQDDRAGHVAGGQLFARRGDLQVRLACHVAVEELADFPFGQRAHELVNGLAVAEELDVRNAADAELAGDEPYMIACRLKDVPVVVGKNRFAAGMQAINKFQPDVIVLDDAFQHLKLKRDIDLVLLDWMMPELDGVEVLTRLRADGGTVPDGCPRRREQGRQNGAVDEEALAEGQFLGRTAVLEPGQAETITFDLEPGKYLFICNINFGPNSHAANGQILSVTVNS